MRFCKSSGKRYWRYDVALAVLLATAMPQWESARLERVIDGDTIWVYLNGASQRIRYLGINAPERDTDCGKVATKVNQRLLKGKHLWLMRDADVSNQDVYGRLLRYVYAGDVLVNAELVREGVAWARRYERGIDLYPRFAELEQEAESADRGCL